MQHLTEGKYLVVLGKNSEANDLLSSNLHSQKFSSKMSKLLCREKLPDDKLTRPGTKSEL